MTTELGAKIFKFLSIIIIRNLWCVYYMDKLFEDIYGFGCSVKWLPDQFNG
jgi:hypothetical protein